jgi:hypothetical protein
MQALFPGPGAAAPGCSVGRRAGTLADPEGCCCVQCLSAVQLSLPAIPLPPSPPAFPSVAVLGSLLLMLPPAPLPFLPSF